MPFFRPRGVSCEIYDMLESRAASGRAAFEIVDTLSDRIIAAHRQRFGGTYLAAELIFAPAKSEFTKQLFEEMQNRLHVDDAKDAVQKCIGD